MPVIFGLLAVTLGVIGLAFTIPRVVRLARTAPLLRVPVVAEQEIVFDAPGPILLNIEGPHFTTRFRDLTYTLSDRVRGTDVPLHTVWLRMSTSSWKRARLSIRRFALDAPGSFVLRIAGLVSDASYADCALVFTRPLSPVLPIAIVGIVLSGALTIGGIVLTAFSIADVPVDPDTVAVSSLPDAPASAGRQLRSDRAVVAAWREVRWPPAHLSLDVPADWAARRNDATQLDLRPADLQTTFVTVRLSPAPELAADDFLRVARLQGASRFAASRVAGYTVKTLGAASGVLSFERSKESTKEQLSWTSIVPGSKQMITISLSAATEKFAQAEPVLGAILDSIRIGGLPPLEKGE